MDVLSSRFGVNDHVYEWFRSYLSGGTQIFSTSADTSNAVAHIFSVPQGSVVGPILFITYTEDVEDLIETFSFKDYIYADDIQLLAHICDSQRCCDVEEISRDVWLKSKISALRNGNN